MPDNLSQRKHVRVEVLCEVACKVAGQDEPITGYTRDISCGGVCLMTDGALSKDDELDISFSMDEVNTVSAHGRVAWTETFSIGDQTGWDNGIQFTDISPDDKELISSFIEAN